MGDRRKIERFKLRLPARLDVLGRYEDVQQATLSLETDNICSGGAYFTTLSPLPQGTSVKIDLLLDFERLQTPQHLRPRIKVNGKVLRSERTGMAVRFDKSYQIIPAPNA